MEYVHSTKDQKFEYELKRILILLGIKNTAWVFALYNSYLTRNEVVERLKNELSFPVYEFSFSKRTKDPLVFVKKVDKRQKGKKAIICFYDIQKGFPEFFGHLDLKREVYVEFPYSLVFWVTEHERVEVARRAPNFFSRNDGVFDFRVEPGALMDIQPSIFSQPVSFTDEKDWVRKRKLFLSLWEDHSKAEKPDLVTLGNLAQRLGTLYAQVGRYKEALKWYEEGHNLFEQIGNKQGVAGTLHNIATIHQNRGEYDKALELYNRSLEISKQTGDREGVARTTHQLGWVYQEQGGLQKALALHEQSLEIAKQLNHKVGIALALHHIAMIHQQKGDLDKALPLYEQSLRIFKQLDDKQGIAASIHQIAKIHQDRGALDEALKLYEESLKIGNQLGDKQGIASTIHNIGMIYQRKGDLNEALKLYNQALKISEELGYKQGIALTYGQLGRLFKDRKDFKMALSYYLQSLSLSRELESPHAELTLRDISSLRSQLGNEEFGRLWKEVRGEEEILSKL